MLAILGLVTVMLGGAGSSGSSGSDELASVDRGPALIASAAQDAVLTDLEGMLPAAERVVFKIDDRAAAAVAGLPATNRDGWYSLSIAEVAAVTDRACIATSLAKYWAPAFIDRLGGLAWPDQAVLIGFSADATEAMRRSAIGASGGRAHHYSSLRDLVLVRLDVSSGLEVLQRVDAICKLPGVAFAEADLSITGRSSLTPTDPFFSSSWAHLNTGQFGGLVGFDLRSTEAWDLGTGSPEVAVLIIDTGVEFAHPDLNMLPGRDFTTSALDGVPGGDPTNEFENHGTPVAGCVSSRMDNGLGTCGMAPSCPSVSARCFVGTTSDGAWTANYSWTANALNWAVANNVLITNNSNYYGSSSAAVALAYASSRESGAIHMASAGNSGDTEISYPASLPSVFAVGAAHRSGVRASFSCYGPLLDHLVPGASIVAADRTGASGYSLTDYVSVSGTSFASPLAAGIAALMRSRNPKLTPDEITSTFIATARDLGPAGFDFDTGWGLLDAAAAVAAVPGICQGDLDGDGQVTGLDLGILLVDWAAGTLAADLNDDGLVDGTDLAILLPLWGPCP